MSYFTHSELFYTPCVILHTVYTFTHSVYFYTMRGILVVADKPQELVANSATVEEARKKTIYIDENIALENVVKVKSEK